MANIKQQTLQVMCTEPKTSYDGDRSLRALVIDHIPY